MSDKIICLPMPASKQDLLLQVRRGPEDDAKSQEDPFEVRMRQDQQARLVFVRTVYINASLFYFIAALIVLIVSSLRFRIFGVLPVPPIVWLVLALVILTSIKCIGTRRLKEWILWTLVLTMVLLVTLFSICFTYAFSVVQLISSGLVSALVLIIMVAAGARCRKSCLPNAIVYSVIVAFCLAGIFTTAVLCFVSPKLEYVLAFCIFLVIQAMVFAIMQSQFIHGRMHYVPLGQEVLCGLALFATKWVLLLCSAIFIAIAEFRLSEVPHILRTTNPVQNS